MKIFGKELSFNGFKVFTEANLTKLSQLYNDVFDFKAKSIEIDDTDELFNSKDVEGALNETISRVETKANVIHNHDVLIMDHVVLKTPDGLMYKLNVLEDGSLYTTPFDVDEQKKGL